MTGSVTCHITISYIQKPNSFRTEDEVRISQPSPKATPAASGGLPTDAMPPAWTIKILSLDSYNLYNVQLVNITTPGDTPSVVSGNGNHSGGWGEWWLWEFTVCAGRGAEAECLLISTWYRLQIWHEKKN
jgi:hypothetical protein